MFKKLFLILFLVQTLASSAWGAVGVSTFSPSEQIEMKVMHHVMHMDTMTMSGMKTISGKMGQCLDNQQTMSCDQCNTANCHNLLCASIHAAPVYNLVGTFKLDLLPMAVNSNVVLDEPLTITAAQPELPPPNTTSI